MTTDHVGVPNHVALPEDFNIDRCNRGEYVTTQDDETYIVVESQLHGDRALVHEDVVTYGQFDHPALTGFAGLMTLVAAFLAPIRGAYELLAPTGTTIPSILLMAAVILGSWAFAYVLLYRTVVGDEVFRFLEWNDHRAAIIAMRKNDRIDGVDGGETA